MLHQFMGLKVISQHNGCAMADAARYLSIDLLAVPVWMLSLYSSSENSFGR